MRERERERERERAQIYKLRSYEEQGKRNILVWRDGVEAAALSASSCVNGVVDDMVGDFACGGLSNRRQRLQKLH